MLKPIPLPPSNYLITYYQTLDEATWLMRQKTIKHKCFEKLAIFFKKMPTFDALKRGKPTIITRNYAVLYYQTSKEIPWPQKLENLKNVKIFQKLDKNYKN